ncbi:hypothetical protein V1477_003361 [Vespula maculifrons]|uniref:Uncharacterized protein n=1 Tax=Vespula maculifrons TaxID=7453 RepID=A0ABD2CUB1_VESMC
MSSIKLISAVIKLIDRENKKELNYQNTSSSFKSMLGIPSLIGNFLPDSGHTFHKVVQSNFGMILAINSELKSTSDTLISFAFFRNEYNSK